MTGVSALRELRRNAGLTQTELAEALGVGQASICAYETGAAWPSMDKLPALRELLAVDMDTLVAALLQVRGGERCG